MVDGGRPRLFHLLKASEKNSRQGTKARRLRPSKVGLGTKGPSPSPDFASATCSAPAASPYKGAAAAGADWPRPAHGALARSRSGLQGFFPKVLFPAVRSVAALPPHPLEEALGSAEVLERKAKTGFVLPSSLFHPLWTRRGALNYVQKNGVRRKIFRPGHTTVILNSDRHIC